MDYFKNVNKLYYILFFHNLIPAYVIERLFWQERGMTVFMVVVCEIIYAITIVFFELPTGILADKFGRKAMLVFGAVLSMFEFIILLVAHTFWSFALVVFLAGIAGACTSGALNALLYDSLLEVKRENLFVKIIGRMNSLDFTGALLAALSGSLLAEFYGFEFNYILSAGSMFIALVFTIFLKEPPRRRQQEVKQGEKDGLKDYFFHAVAFYQDHPKIASIIIHAMAIGACVNYLDEFWQLYLDEVNFPVLLFGVYAAFLSLARIPGNLTAAFLIKYFNTESIILSVLGVTTVCFFMTAIFPGLIGLMMIIIIFLASGVVDPVVSGSLHHHGISDIRATVESIQSLIERAITFVVGIGFGIVSSKASIIVGIVYLGVVSCLVFFRFLKRVNWKELNVKSMD
jgi:MFS family permease